MKRPILAGAADETLFALLLIVLILIVYAPSVRFGAIWDDPRFYMGTAEQTSLRQIFTSPQPPTFQFYRPLAVLYNRWLISPNGIVNVPLAHMVQIGLHIVITLALVPLVRAFGFDTTHARLTAVCFALFPFSYQAIAWQQNQQPLMFAGIVLAALTAHYAQMRQSIILLAISLIIYAMALLVQEGSLLFVVVFFGLAALRWPDLKRRWRGWPLLHLALAALYALIWSGMPRHVSVTGPGFQFEVLAYLLQGVAYPVARLMAELRLNWPPAAWAAIFAATGLALALGVYKWNSARVALVSCAWIIIGLAPIWAGLSWEYVQLGPRLLYPAAAGIAALWGGWGAWACSNRHPCWRRTLGGIALALTLAVSLHQLNQFQRLYEISTAHLARAVNLLASNPNARLLFINFPDRIEMRPSPYPLGFWGITLAPVVQDLADYARVHTGHSAQDKSLSDFLTGAGEREVWPYRVDMRGAHTDPAGLFEAAVWADAVYLTRYRADGTLDLQHVGKVRYGLSTGQPLATLGDSVQLVAARTDISAHTLTLELVWDCLQPLQVNDTIFVHFWQNSAHVADADGDSLGGMIPLYVWSPGTQIVDVRHIDISGWRPGQYAISVGLYNRESGSRYSAFDASGAQFHYDEIPVGAFSLP